MAATSPRPVPDPDADGAGAAPQGMLRSSARALWPSATRLELSRGRRAPPDAVDYAVVPSVGSPRWLIPVPSRSAARAVVGQERAVRRRTASRLLALALGSGVVRRLPVRRLRVTGGEESLVGAVQALTGADTSVAVRLGSWPVARSVVLRVMESGGATHAYGKVGIDALGKASVAAEADALRRIRELDLERVVAPEPLHRFTWRDLDVLLVSPLVPPPRPSVPGPPVAAMLEVGRAVGARTEPLRASGWWHHARGRLGTVADPEVHDALAAALTTLGRADCAVPLGPCHGDWTPWNMASVGDRVMLWDWEHFAEDVPLGVDLVHYLAQQLRVETGTGAAAEEAWVEQTEDALHRHVRLSAHQRDLVRVSYLVEVNLRFVLDRQSTPGAGTTREGWGPPLLTRLTRRLQERA